MLAKKARISLGLLPSRASLLRGGRQLMAVRRPGRRAASSNAFPLLHVFSDTETQLWSYFSSPRLRLPATGNLPEGVGQRRLSTQGTTIPRGPDCIRVVRQVLCHCDRDMAETHVNTIGLVPKQYSRLHPGAQLCPSTTHEMVPAIRPWGATPEQGNMPSQIGNKPPSLQGVIEAYAARP